MRARVTLALKRVAADFAGLPVDPPTFDAAAEFRDVAALVHGGADRREPTAGFKDGAPIRCGRIYVGKRLRETPRELVTLP